MKTHCEFWLQEQRDKLPTRKMNIIRKSVIVPFFFLSFTPFSSSSRKVNTGTLFGSCKKLLCDLFQVFLGGCQKIDLDCLFLLTFVRFVSTGVGFGWE